MSGAGFVVIAKWEPDAHIEVWLGGVFEPERQAREKWTRFREDVGGAELLYVVGVHPNADHATIEYSRT